MASATLITAKQFGQMAFGETEDYELVEGELIPLSSATFAHAWVRDELNAVLRAYLRRTRSGSVASELDCQLGEALVRRPDLSIFLARDGRTVPLHQIPVPFPPDIAIEVLSPNEKAVELNRKLAEYFKAGTGEVWLIDHQNAVATIQSQSSVRRIVAGGLIESLLLPEFSVRLDDLFPNP